MRQSNTTRNRKEHFISKLEFNYDEINDLLYVYKKDSSVYSNVMIGDFHLEFDKDIELIGIEVLNASDILKEYDIPQKILKNISKIELKVVARGNSLLIFMIIHSMGKSRSATITMNNLEMPIMDAIAAA
jgi:uncharacterized protein YuzE